LATEQTVIDVVIPVYNEGANILATFAALAREVRTSIKVLVCYDRDDDDTLTAIRDRGSCGLEVVFVKNRGLGAHGAVMTGFAASRSAHVLVYPADDDYNAGILDEMFQRAARGSDIVCASRFMRGGSMVGCPWLKSLLVRIAAFTLYHVGRIPTHDPTNGFRLFSRRLLQAVTVESTEGFTYSLELLGKCHRLGWPVDEVPARWIERTQGASRFKVLRWIPSYLRWYRYIFATTFLSRGPDSVTLKG
jgi:glycosyltransferase involved in cell wall biosynthesis